MQDSRKLVGRQICVVDKGPKNVYNILKWIIYLKNIRCSAKRTHFKYNGKNDYFMWAMSCGQWVVRMQNALWTEKPNYWKKTWNSAWTHDDKTPKREEKKK